MLMASTGGRGPKFGEGAWRMPCNQPSHQVATSFGILVGVKAFTEFEALVCDLDAEPSHPVAHLAQGQTQAGPCGCAIQAMLFQGPDQNVSLDGVEVSREIWGERRFNRVVARCGQGGAMGSGSAAVLSAGSGSLVADKPRSSGSIRD